MSSYTSNLDPATLSHLLNYTRSTERRDHDWQPRARRQQSSSVPTTSSTILDRIRRYLLSTTPTLPTYDPKSDRVPLGFVCPLTRQIYEDPVFTRCKHVFEKTALREHLSSYRRCPITSCKQVITFRECEEFPTLLQLIQTWIAENPERRDPYAPPPLPKIDLDNAEIPDAFVCSIYQAGEAMQDPVYTKCKHVFEKAAIRKWIADGNNNCPVCRAGTEVEQLTSWTGLKTLIYNWKQKHPTITSDITLSIGNPRSRMVRPTIISRRSPIETDDISNTFHPAVRALNLLLDCLKLVDIESPHQTLDLGKFMSQHPQRRAYLEPSVKQAYGNVYILYCQLTGKKPSHPKFGEFAFNQREHLNVPQKLRQEALALSILKTLGILFRYQEQFEDINLLNLFDRLPEKMRKEIYGSTYLFLQASGDYIDNHPRLGEKAFRRQGGFYAPDEVRSAAIETYLQRKL